MQKVNFFSGGHAPRPLACRMQSTQISLVPPPPTLPLYIILPPFSQKPERNPAILLLLLQVVHTSSAL